MTARDNLALAPGQCIDWWRVIQDLHMHGMEGVYFYTRTKVVTSRWPALAERLSNTLVMPTH